MKYLATLFLAFSLAFMNALSAQDLEFYIQSAKTNSPLIQDNKNQSEAALLEVERLKAFYKKSQISLSGSYLFAPVISKEIVFRLAAN